MNVYVVEGCWAYEPGQILSVFDDEEKAVVFAEEERNSGDYDKVVIHAWEVE